MTAAVVSGARLHREESAEAVATVNMMRAGTPLPTGGGRALKRYHPRAGREEDAEAAAAAYHAHAMEKHYRLLADAGAAGPGRRGLLGHGGDESNAAAAMHAAAMEEHYDLLAGAGAAGQGRNGGGGGGGHHRSAGRALHGVTALPVPAMPKIDYASFLKGWSSSADWKALGMPAIGDVVTLLGWDKLDWNQILGDVAAAAPESADLVGGSLQKFLAFWGVNAELPAGPQMPRWTDLFKVNPATGKPVVDLNKIVAGLAAKKNGTTAAGAVDASRFSLGGLFDAAVNATQGRSATLNVPTFREMVAALPHNATAGAGGKAGNGTAAAGLAAALQGAAGQMPPLAQVVADLKKTAGALGKVTAALGVEPVKVEGLPSMAQVINGLDALDKVLKKVPKKEELAKALQG